MSYLKTTTNLQFNDDKYFYQGVLVLKEPKIIKKNIAQGASLTSKLRYPY